MRLFTAMKTFTIVAALVASGTSLAMAQNSHFEASSLNGDLDLVRGPDGAAAYVGTYAGTSAPVIRHHTIRHRR